MKNNFLNFIILFFCVLMVSALCACKQQSIKFYRESKAQEVVNDIKLKENQPKGREVFKSSGVIIYKDNSVNNSSDRKNVNFGPKDIKFDLPDKIRKF